ncbi:MAG: recombinase family protein [bacterium]
MNNIYKVGLYIRISREDDIKYDESQSITNQRIILEDYIKDKDYKLVDIYVDDGYSGTNFDRPAFSKMIKDIENKKINTIITKDLSRLGRDHIETGYYIEKYFPLNKVRYIAINDNYDSEKVGSNDMNAFKFILNDYYAKDISNKVKLTINSKKKNGEFLGATPPYGYKFKSKTNKKKLIVDEVSSKVVKRMFTLYASGKSLDYIAKKFTKEKIEIPSIYKKLNRGLKSSAYGVWQTRTIGEMLNNPTYIGNLTQGRRRKVSYKVKKVVRVPKNEWIIAENTHEPIIDKDTFEKVQNILKVNKGRVQSENNVLLKGFIKCKECGHTIGINSVYKKNYCFCNYYKKYSKLNLCTPHSMPYSKLESMILKEIRKECRKCLNKDLSSILRSMDRVSLAKESIIKIITKKEEEICINKKACRELYVEKLKQKIEETTYLEVYNILNEEYISLLEDIKVLKTDYEYIDKNNKYDYDKLIEDFLLIKKPSRELLANIVEKIEIDENKNIDIYYKFKKTSNI